MEKSKEELIVEHKESDEKFAALEAKHEAEIVGLKKIEDELRLRLMFFEGIANSTVDGFLVVDLNGQKILQTQRTVELWKIPQEVVDDSSGDKQVAHVMHMTVDPKKFVDEIMYQVMHPDEKRLDEVELIDGTIMERYSSPVIGPDGTHYGRIYTFHDITERKNSEKQLLQLNADKDRFISILAHDLRSPFNSLLGFSELLKNELRFYPIEKTEEMVKTIYDTIQKTHELLEDTLQWASIQSKKTTFNPTVTNIDGIISEVAYFLEPSARTKNITIENKDKEEIFVKTDPYMIKAILRNLVSNAIKFTNKGGKIEISATQTSSNTTIRVTDNGVGINPDVFEKLFSFSAMQSTNGTDDEKGTGLGLLLCKEFVEKHGGKIWVESIVNKGTTVSFTIPS